MVVVEALDMGLQVDLRQMVKQEVAVEGAHIQIQPPLRVVVLEIKAVMVQQVVKVVFSVVGVVEWVEMV
jgi:hypothetical protein